MGDQLSADRACQVGRNGEAQASAQPIDQGVDPDDPAVDIAERTATVARINRRISLEIVFVDGAGQITSSFGAKHPDGEGVVEFKGSADTADKFSHPHQTAVAPLHRGQTLNIGFENREVGLVVDPDNFEWQTAPILAASDYSIFGIGPRDNMSVGQNIAVLADDEARRLAFLGLLWRPAGAIREEKLPGKHAGRLTLLAANHLEYNNTRSGFLVDIGKSITQGPRRRLGWGGDGQKDRQAKLKKNPVHWNTL